MEFINHRLFVCYSTKIDLVHCEDQFYINIPFMIASEKMAPSVTSDTSDIGSMSSSGGHERSRSMGSERSSQGSVQSDQQKHVCFEGRTFLYEFSC